MMSSQKDQISEGKRSKSPSARITKEDVALAQTAKNKAGGPAILAKMFGVTPPAASEWGRTRPIPRHVRPRLETFVRSTFVPDASAVEMSPATEAGTGRALHELIRLFHTDFASPRVAHLPRHAQRRYEERVMEILARVRRELEEFQAVLEAEPRRGRRRRANGQGKGGPG